MIVCVKTDVTANSTKKNPDLPGTYRWKNRFPRPWLHFTSATRHNPMSVLFATREQHPGTWRDVSFSLWLVQTMVGGTWGPFSVDCKQTMQSSVIGWTESQLLCSSGTKVPLRYWPDVHFLLKCTSIVYYSQPLTIDWFLQTFCKIFIPFVHKDNSILIALMSNNNKHITTFCCSKLFPLKRAVVWSSTFGLHKPKRGKYIHITSRHEFLIMRKSYSKYEDQ